MAQNLHIESEEIERGEDLPQLLSIAENSQDAIIGENLDCIITSWNTGAVKMFGYSADEVIGKSCALLVPAEIKDEMRTLIDKIIVGETIVDYDSVRLRKDGSKINVSLSISPVHSEDGTIVGVSIVERDITKLKWYENRIRRISRLYEALGKCNQAIVRCTSEEELYEQVCTILVQSGGMVVVWVGLIDETSKYIDVAYSFGNGKEHLSDIHLSVNADDSFGSGPTGISLRENRPVWSNDFMHDPTTEPWHELAEKVNLRASVSLPLVKNGIPIGNISLYSDIANVFDNETQKIITEIVADVNLALDNFVNKDKIKKYEESLLRIQTIVENSHDAIIGETLDGTILIWNNGAVKMFGYSVEEAIGKSALTLFPPEIKAELPKLLNKIRAGEVITDYDSIRVYKDGSKINVSISVAPVYSVDKIIVGASIIIRDITERKMLENEVLKVSTDKYKKLFMSSRDAIMTLEPPSWNFTSGNPEAIKMFQAKDETDFLFHGPWSLSPEFQPDGRRSDEKAKEMIDKAMKEGSNFFEWTHKKLNGEEFPAEVLLSKVNQNGNGFLHALIRDVTERIKKEEATRQVNLIVNNSQDGIFSETLDGIVTSWNKGAEKIFGYSAEEMIGKSISSLIPPEMKDEMKTVLNKIKSGEIITDHDSVKIRKDGSRINLSHSISPIKTKDGKIVGISVIERDITERKKLEKKLEEYQEEKFKVLFDNALDGVLLADVSTKHFYLCNPAMSKMLGYSPEEIEKLGVNDIHPKEDLPNLLEQFDRQMRGEISLVKNVRVKRKDGTIFYSDINSSLVNINSRRYLLGIFRDITERKNEEEIIKKDKFDLKEAQRIGHFGHWDWDAKVDKITWSESYYNIFGLDPKKSPPGYEEHLKMYTPQSAALLDNAVKKSMQTGESYELDLEQICVDGTRKWITARGEVKYDENHKIIGLRGTSQDVTERKMNELHIKELNEVRHKFLDIISHQLRTPLTSINWNLEAILDGDFGKLEDTTRKFLQFTHKASVEITRRIHDLLSAMDIEEGRVILDKEEISLDSLVTSVTNQVMGKCGLKNISCNFISLVKNPISIEIDAEKIRVAISNLVNNAILYNKEGGEVSVKLEQTNNHVRFEVKDTGVGIPESEQHYIFSRFFRASNASIMEPNSFGLGLFITKNFIEQHGGTVGFKSKEGEGSTFWFELPLNNVS